MAMVIQDMVVMEDMDRDMVDTLVFPIAVPTVATVDMDMEDSSLPLNKDKMLLRDPHK